MQAKTLRLACGETVRVESQWAAETEKRGTTVSESAWAFSGSGALAGDALADTEATVLLTPRSCGTLTNTATLANGEVLIASRCVLMDTPPARDYA